jgi:hypothetical protein
MNPVVLLKECEGSFLALSERIRKYCEALGDLAKDPNITQEKITKKEVKMDAAVKRVDRAAKAMTNFLKTEFKVDYAAASDEQKVVMDAWKKRVKKLLFEMGQKMSVRNLLVPADALFEDE